jgi:hypothetical protein
LSNPASSELSKLRRSASEERKLRKLKDLRNDDNDRYRKVTVKHISCCRRIFCGFICRRKYQLMGAAHDAGRQARGHYRKTHLNSASDTPLELDGISAIRRRLLGCVSGEAFVSKKKKEGKFSPTANDFV